MTSMCTHTKDPASPKQQCTHTHPIAGVPLLWTKRNQPTSTTLKGIKRPRVTK